MVRLFDIVFDVDKIVSELGLSDSGLIPLEGDGGADVEKLTFPISIDDDVHARADLSDHSFDCIESS